MDFKAKLRELWRGDEHERYSELCALSTAGVLSDAEQSELDAHLLRCHACVDLLRAYRATARSAMPLLAPQAVEPAQAQKPWSVENAKKQLLNRIEATRAAEKPKLAPAVTRPGMLLSGRMISLAAAAVIVLAAMLSAFTYRLGEHRGSKTAQTISSATLPESRLLQKSVDEHLLEQQSQEVVRLEQELKKKIGEARALQEKILQEGQNQDFTIAALGSDKDSLAAERDALNHKLQEAQSTLASAQQRLADLQEEHTRQSLHTASLEKRVNELSTEMKDQEAAAQPSREATLYADSDMQELMGARELYIADVFDVDRDGKPQKAFGRVFYTGGKSLIFYAFDLDKQPGVRAASAFQAWGRRGPADKHPLSMGNFKLDNAANRRWVLRFDNPKMLAQLDAVFVTMESRSGEQKPTGKQLLFASLRIPPNHP
jgi:hypothetical protein